MTMFIRKRWVNKPVVVPGGTQASGKGYTMYAPERPLGRSKTEAEDTSRFKPFSGKAKKLGAD